VCSSDLFRLALFGDHAKKIHCRDGDMETCSMCGDLCAVKMVNELFGTGKKDTTTKGKKPASERIDLK
jgi:phosphomethylpyrimidine synthase